MTPTDLYDQVAIEFPPVWPQNPEWVWINVHDGKAAKPTAISEVLERYISSSEVVVVVHSEPGAGVVLPRERAVAYIAEHVLRHEIQASDPQFTCFVAVSRAGVATGWRKITPRPTASAPNDA